MSAIVPIVEGEGEVEAVPLLLRKVLAQRCQQRTLTVAKPKNAHGKGRLLRDLERFLQYAAMTPGCKGILVLLDAHDDCAKDLAARLSQRCKELGLNVPVAVVCAVREYEAWFLASLDTIKGKPVKGKPGLSESAQFTGFAEGLSGVKEWLTHHMPQGRAYKETSDQAALTEYVDLALAYERSRSFRRFCHATDQLVQAMENEDTVTTP